MLEPVYTPDALRIFDEIGYDYYRTEASYARALRGAVRGLWSGAIDVASFTTAMESTIQRGFRQAFLEGIKAEGLQEGDLTQNELILRDDRIIAEYDHIASFAEAIVEGSKANGGKLEPLAARVQQWVARYNELRYMGQLVAARDKKLEWRYGDTDHCDDCLRMNGRVYRASTWLRYGIFPRGSMLQCFGIHCQCGFYDTDADITKGRPPALKGPRS